MTMGYLEKKFEDLAALFKQQQRDIERQRHEIERLQAVNEIQNLMSRFEYLSTSGQNLKIWEMFAQKTPGVAAHFESWGHWEGTKGIQRIYGPGGLYDPDRENADQHGKLIVHTLTTPVIEVSGDCNTAKGVWTAPGFITLRERELGHDGKKNPKAGQFIGRWSWYKYGIDFVKEDGKWKFWHFRVSPLIACGIEKSWVDEPRIDPRKDYYPPEVSPDTVNNEWYGWTPEMIPENKPLPPEPFEVFDDRTAY